MSSAPTVGVLALQGGVAWLKSWFPDLEIGSELADGPPVQVLVDQTRRNRLVVVGTRGRGGFAGMLLGSVSQHCVSHSKCPFVVVPNPEGRGKPKKK